MLTFNPLLKANKGKAWNLPPASSLPPINKTGPGFGCDRAPNQAVGMPLFDIDASSPVIAPGFIAPYYVPGDNTTVPVVCPATPECNELKLAGSFCMPQGRYEPMPCPSGYYCPDYKTVMVCPEGYYCLTGSSKPKKCLPLSFCPAGSVQQSHFGFLLFVILFDIVLCIGLLIRRFMESRWIIFPSFLQRLVSKAHINTEFKFNNSIVIQSTESQPNTETLVKAFKRGLMGQHDLTMNFSFKGMSMRLPTGKTILEGVTGEIRAGRMTAIMGPSGAGKTTFMSVLMGKVKRSGGDLLINGVPCEMEGLKKIIGFVPQEDIMLRELTVRENILHSARCRLPSDWTSEEINEYVDNIIKVLNLTHVANSQIGDELTRGVSGGQRKRVNIGMELAAIPMSLFLDEPTSGLDATSALDVANVLKSISRMGTTIISIIHQPRVEIFDKFDDILMIAPGGRTAYLGPVQNAQPYFENLGFYFEPSANRADILMDIIAGRGVHSSSYNGPIYSVDEIVKLWEAELSTLSVTARNEISNEISHSSAQFMVSDQVGKYFSNVKAEDGILQSIAIKNYDHLNTVTINSSLINVDIVESFLDISIINKLKLIADTRGASFMKQMWYCHTRSLIQQSRYLGSLGLELGVGLLAGGIMGITSLDDELYIGILAGPFAVLNPSPSHWFVALYGLLIGVTIALSAAPSAVKVFSEERTLYFREAASGHSKPSYFLGKTFGSIYRVILSSAHFTAVLYFIARIPIDIVTFYCLVLLSSLIIYGIGHVISMILSRKDAPLIAVFVGLFMGVLCGFGLSLNDAQDSKIGIFIFNLGANRWFAEAFFGLWVNAYDGVFDFTSSAYGYGYVSDKTWFNMGIMALLAVGYRVLAFALMVLLQRDKQR